jgi:hypothetical protein
MKNGRENRTNGNQEKGKEEKEALRGQYEVKRGTPKASPEFFAREFVRWDQSSEEAALFAWEETFGACFSRAGHKPRNAQKVQ